MTFTSQSKYNKLTKEEKIKELQDILLDMNEARRKHWNLNLTSKEDLKQFPQLKEMAFSVDLKGIDEKVITSILKNYKELGSEYYTTLNHIGIFDDTDFVVRPKSGGYAFTKAKTLTGEIHLNQKLLSNFDNYIETMKYCSEIRHISPNINPKNYQYYVFTHEFAHTIYSRDMLENNLIGMDKKVYKDFQKELKTIFERYKIKMNDIDSKIKELDTKFVLDTQNFTSEDSENLKALKKERKETFVSNYAIRDNLEDEFMAECFTDAKLSDSSSKTSIEVLKLIDKYFKR